MVEAVLTEGNTLHRHGVEDTPADAALARDDATDALWSWREEQLPEFEPESSVDGVKVPVDTDLVERARSLNELRLAGVISESELAAEREAIRREIGLPPSGES
jgi:hypothetical protein